MLGWPNGIDQGGKKKPGQDRMAEWPNNIPHGPRKRLEGVMGHRSFGPAEIWGEVKEWLEEHHVQAPERLPDNPKM